MPREIVTYPDPILARKSAPIEEITDEIRELADEMVEAMYENRGIGLAAPQIGENIRLVTMDLSGPDEQSDLKVFVNPRITAKSGSTESEEGCLSVRGYQAKVKRAEFVTVEALDLDGNEITIEADDIMAICFQHELDHLDGVLFIDHISRLKRSLYEKKIKKWKK